jgi:hypothetical protein
MKKGRKRGPKRGTNSLALSNVRKFFPNVKTVTDADDNAIVEVTANDVKHSAKKDINGCAMAIAAKRQFHATGMIVAPSVAYVVKHDKAIRFQLPQSVQKEIVSFDRGGGFAEGTYQLNYPKKSQRLGARVERAYSESRSHDNKHKRRFQHETTGIRATLGGKKRD